MNTPHKHAALIKAWADGATIEYQTQSDKAWQTTKDPSWDPSTEYRVKPKGKYTVAAYKSFTTGDGWYENKRTFQLDPAAGQYKLVQSDGEGNPLFLFETFADADAACQAVNKSLTFA